MFEKKHQKVVSLPLFVHRVLSHIWFALLMAFAALIIGVLGYHWFDGLGWVDSLLNASMILGGMGPVNVLTTTGAKLFASFYALFSGLFFIAIMGIILTPFIHRVLHKFHMDENEKR